ncbi:hypothetical protein E5288_WYG017279 [Bos mutus]|uniref:Neuromedin-S n=1 Tax=Bos mutus TaxID=72004 RepID=A0A6B0RQD2_9CETA|nr:hypothetical protein [Bos mutus]
MRSKALQIKVPSPPGWSDTRTHLWPAKRIWTLKMKYLAQFPSILAIYCFCLLQIPSSGFPRPLADASDGLDIVKFEQMAYWASLSRQPKVKKIDVSKIILTFLFHYSRTQEPAHPVKTGFPPVHPLMRLAAKLADRRMKTFWRRPDWVTVCVFILQDYTATLGRPFFLFRPRNGRNLDFDTWNMRLLSFRSAPASQLEHNLDQPAVAEALAGQSV